MATELIIYNRPSNGSIKFNDPIGEDTSILARGANSTNQGGIAEPSSANPSQFYKTSQANTPVTPVDIGLVSPAAQGPQGLRVDLYNDVALPINFTINDIKEPDKRKTSWSKTITIPGTKNNNRIFNHIYELDKDGWMTIGSQSFYQGFNPNLRKEVVLVQDGIEIFKGNLQLKSARKFYDGNVEYEVIVNGDLTSLFFDIGASKLSDLDFSEFEHLWSKQNITNSWFGVNKLKNGNIYTTINNAAFIDIISIERDNVTGRVVYTTSAPHGYVKLDFVFISPTDAVIQNSAYDGYKTVTGVYSVAEVFSSTKFSVNCQYTTGLLALGTQTVPSGHMFCTKQTAKGNGYAYPMVSWGDEYDQNSFPVVSFTPGLFVKGIFDKIMKQTNSTYESNFLNSEFFKRLMLIEKKSTSALTSREVAERSFRVGTQYIYATDTMAPINSKQWYWAQSTSTASNANSAPDGTYLRFTQETGGVGDGVYYDGSFNGLATGINNWNSDNSFWNVTSTGEYDLSVSINLTAEATMTGFDGVTASGGFDPSVKTYWPGSINIANNNAQMPLGSGAEGLAIRLTLWRQRGTLKTQLGQASYAMPMNRAQNAGYAAILYNTPIPFPPPGWISFTASSYVYSPTNWRNVNLQVQTADKYFTTGDRVWSELSYYVQAQTATTIIASSPFQIINRRKAILFRESVWDGRSLTNQRDIVADLILKINQPSFITARPTGKKVEGSMNKQDSYLPKDLSCKDFITGLIKMFNLHIQPDALAEKKYIIEPREDFYLDGVAPDDFVDWTDKVDYNTIKITPLGELGAKTYTFENKDENDYWNTKFKTERGRPYMQYSKTIQNDFLKNEYKISLPFGSTVMINNPDNSDVVMPAVHLQENNVMKPASQTAPRILLWMGPKPYTQNGKLLTINSNRTGWEFLSSVESVKANYTAAYGTDLATASAIAASASDCFFYPYAGTVDSPNEPFWDLNWYNQEAGDFVYWDSARWTSHNLYNTYWKGFINEVSDPSSLIVEAEFRLSPTDIQKLDFRKIYVIDNIWYRLQRVIDYDAIGRTPTRCELLKVKAPTKFVRKIAFTGEPIDREVDFDRLINTVEVAYGPPKRRFLSEGYTNNLNASSLSNATISVNGKGNFVGQGDSIKVNGNENIVGESSANVHISNGNGNFITGGVTNVTIIGTDKKVIRESNVSYINGIRYKNGVPISRVNVIDGGFNSATSPTSLNTVANIVEGCEDVVIKKGSATYEDIIDAGQDAILPDVAELGISSTTTPRPKTTFSGGYDAALPEGQTIAESIREMATYKVG